MTATTPSPAPQAKQHASWCITERCPGGDHVSPLFVVPGKVLLGVEAYLERKESPPGPRINLFEEDGEQLLAMSPEQAERLAEVLLRVSRAVRDGSPLEAPAADD